MISSKAHRLYYLIPEDYCRSAVQIYSIDRAAAMAAKKLLQLETGCDGMLLAGEHGIALTFKEWPGERSGFKLAKRQGEVWKLEPKRNTIKGKRIQADLDACAQAQERWQWSLETNLGIYASVYGYLPLQGFHMVVAKIRADGSVLVSVPNRASSPVPMPACAKELSAVDFYAFDKEPHFEPGVAA